MGLREEIEADIMNEIEADLPGNTFEYTYPGAGGETITGPFVPTMTRAGEQLIVGGKLQTVRRTAFIRASLFTSGAPLARRPIKLNDTEYRIAEVPLSGADSHYEIPVVSLSET
jgi:hypothetical protein